MKRQRVYSTCLMLALLFASATSVHAQVNDPNYPEQTYFSKINLSPDTQSYKGQGVIVAVIDEGIWQQHPDLSGNIWNNQNEIPNNGIDDDDNGYADDYYGWNFLDNNANLASKGTHGTAVAGVIGAQSNNIGIRGIAPSVKLMSLIVCGESGCADASILAAIYYATNNGANIINLSLGGMGYVGFTTEYNTAIQYAYDHDVIVVASAGNGDPESAETIGQNLTYTPVSPVCNDNNGHNIVLGVGADEEWSNYGTCVDVMAPGSSIETTLVPQFKDGAYYGRIGGTSFSAPMVAATAAIIWERYPELRNFEVVDMIETAAKSNDGKLDVNEALNTKLLNPKITSVSKTSVSAGDSIEVLGSHFKSSFKVNLNGVTSSSQTLNASAITFNDASSMTLSIPSDLPSGTYQVTIPTFDLKSSEFEVVNSGSSSSSQTDTTSNTPSAGQYDATKLDNSLVSRLKGYILLQTQQHGEAWYINPADSLRYYMADGQVAYEMMRSFGLGITDADLAGIPSVSDETQMLGVESICATNSVAGRIKGQILLQVQQHGEAWYVDPNKCYRIYMKDGNAAYSIMRYLSLGIADSDLEKLPSGTLN